MTLLNCNRWIFWGSRTAKKVISATTNFKELTFRNGQSGIWEIFRMLAAVQEKRKEKKGTDLFFSSGQLRVPMY